MLSPRFIIFWLCALSSTMLLAQQRPDLDFQAIEISAQYPFEKGPQVAIDGGHNNLHQLDGGFGPFAKLLRQDGFQVSSLDEFSSQTLETIDILVIANPLHASNIGNWQLPTPSAFSKTEILILEEWVKNGGRILLIADHMPYGGAADTLAQAFGFHYENGFARNPQQQWPPETYSKKDETLLETIITKDIPFLAGFTGSALKIPDGAIPIAQFPQGHQLYLPEVAWQFEDKTEIESTDGLFLGALHNYGEGKIACFTEAAMFTAQIVQEKFKVGFHAPSAPHNQQFLLNLMHWLASK